MYRADGLGVPGWGAGGLMPEKKMVKQSACCYGSSDEVSLNVGVRDERVGVFPRKRGLSENRVLTWS